MKDDLFEYWVATDTLDEFLGNEPNCPNCGNKMLEIVYGMPGSDIIEKVENGEIFLGGCMISECNPVYHCNNCRRSYFDNLKDYIDEENNFEFEDDE